MLDFHNSVKKKLYCDYLVERCNVVEFGGGRGGDIWKLLGRNAKSITIVDIDQEALQVHCRMMTHDDFNDDFKSTSKARVACVGSEQALAIEHNAHDVRFHHGMCGLAYRNSTELAR
jgi:hypothetical protein